jgi:hypothetical protein
MHYSEAKLTGKGCQPFALCGGVFVFFYSNQLLNYYRSDILELHTTFGDMARKGLQAIPYQGTRKVGAGQNPWHTTETLIGYTAYVGLFFF